MPLSRQSFRIGAAAFVALAAFAVSSATANAGVLVASAPSCDVQSLSKTFLPWWDLADYTALSGGDFEAAGDSWSLSGGAAIADGNESFDVGSPGDSHALSLPAGSSATSPAICVGLGHPTIRFFARRQSGGWLSLATVRVDVLFELTGGSVVSLPIGVVGNGGSWQPTSPLLVVANLLPLLPGQRTPVAFRFTAQGADFSVDDVWVDPYARK